MPAATSITGRDIGLTLQAAQTNRYMRVELVDGELRLARMPGRRTAVVLAAFVLVACSFWRFFDMPVYLRVLYTAVSLFFGLDFIEPAQRCVITKDSIAVESNPWYIQLGLAPPQRKVFPGPATCVYVHSEPLRMFSDGSIIILELEDGREVGLTTTCTLEPVEHHHQLALLVCAFLDLPLPKRTIHTGSSLGRKRRLVNTDPKSK